MLASDSDSDLPSPQSLLHAARSEKNEDLSDNAKTLVQEHKKPDKNEDLGDKTKLIKEDKKPDKNEDLGHEEKKLVQEQKKSIDNSQHMQKITQEGRASNIRNLIVKCSACGKQVNHHDPHRVKRHPHLGVLICKDCSEFYGSGEFSQDDDGDKYCRWCAQGGQVFGCDFCSNVFCTDCLRRNFGRGEARKIKDSEWNCYVCDPSQLDEKVKFCDMILEYSRTVKHDKKNQKKASQNVTLCPLKDLDSLSSQPSDWFPVAFDNVTAASSRFKNKIEKLRRHAISGRSPKQIVRKLEQIVDVHKADIKRILNKVQEKYRTYSREKLEASLADSKVINISDDSDDNAKNSVQPVKDDVVVINGFDVKRQLKFNDTDNSQQPVSNTKTVNNICCETKPLVSDNTCFDQPSVQEKCAIPSVKLGSMSYVEPNISKECSIELFDESSCDIKPSTPVNSNEESSVNVHDFDLMPTQKIVHKPKSDQDVPSANEEANASAKSALLKNSDDSSSESETSTIPDAETAVKKEVKVKKSSSSSLSDSDSERSSSKKKMRRKVSQESKTVTQMDMDCSQYFTPDEIISKDLYADDIYLKSRAVVIVEKLNMADIKVHLSSESQSSDVPCKALKVNEETDELDELKKYVDRLSKLPAGKSTHNGDKDGKKKTQHKADKKKKAAVVVSSASDSFSLSSDGEEKTSTTHRPMVPTKAQLKDMNHFSKDTLLNNDSDSGSSLSDLSSEASNSKSSKSKGSKKADDKSYTPQITNLVSDDDDDSEMFVSAKRRKIDKLLKISLADSDESNSRDKKQKENDTKKKKGQKRKVVYSDDSNKSKSSSSDLSSSDSEEDKGRKQKNKKRRVKMAASSDEEDKKKEDLNGSQNTPGKGRKNIRKLISDQKLTEATREAQEAEIERRKRIADRQKLYNKIVDTNTDGSDPITRKMVLEVDTESKEEVVEIHPDVIEKLKPHQINGVKFMWECTIESLKEIQDSKPGSGCILAHCMGLGKTLQVIAFLYTILTNKHIKKKLRTAMIICPYNTVLNWVAEFEKWLEDAEDEINVFEMANMKTTMSRRDLLEDWQREGGVLILGYNIFARLASGKIPRASKKVKEIIFQKLCDPGADIVVCDEGHMLKNETSFLSKAASKLKTQRRIVLTGTPLQNNLKEYHCMMSFVKPNLLGTLKEFTNRFVNPICNGQYDDSSKYDVKLMKKRVHILHKLLEGCVNRCDYSALTKFLPPKHEFVISVKLSDVQVKLYQHFLDNLACGKGSTPDGGKLFYDYNVLKNVWTHPWILFLSYYRAERKKMMRLVTTSDEDSMASFINDDDKEGATSDSSSASNSSSADVQITDDPQPGPSKKRSDNDSGDEVIRSYKTRSRGGLEGEEEEDVEIVNESLANQWFTQFITEEDKFKLELSGKMVLVMEILKDCQSIGDKVLLFSQSILTLDMIEEILSNADEQAASNTDNGIDDSYDCWEKGIDYFRMDGATNVDLRKRWIELFNDPENERARLFLISTKAGSLGTNLVGANRVILMDASWNPSHDVQAIFRVYRFGQNKPVYIYRLLAHGTMEEKIYSRQVTKLSLSCRVVDEQQIDRHYNAAQLAELYTFEPTVDANRPTPMVPKDRLFADILIKNSDWIVKYHEHDSLLQSSTEDDLTEEERQAAWAEYENEKNAPLNQPNFYEEQQNYGFDKSAFDNSGFAFFNGKNMNIENVIKLLMTEMARRNPGLNNVQLLAKCHKNLMDLRGIYQSRHVQCLRNKQLLISKGEPVLPSLSSYLSQLEVALENISSCVSNVQMKLSNHAINEKLQQGYRFGPMPNMPNATWNPSGQNYFIRLQTAPRPSGNVGSGHGVPGAAPRYINLTSGHPNIRLPAGAKLYAYSTAPKEKPTVVDITSEKDTMSSTVSSTVPIITEADEVPPELNSEQPSTNTKQDSSVEITEID